MAFEGNVTTPAVASATPAVVEETQTVGQNGASTQASADIQRNNGLNGDSIPYAVQDEIHQALNQMSPAEYNTFLQELRKGTTNSTTLKVITFYDSQALVQQGLDAVLKPNQGSAPNGPPSAEQSQILDQLGYTGADALKNFVKDHAGAFKDGALTTGFEDKGGIVQGADANNTIYMYSDGSSRGVHKENGQIVAVNETDAKGRSRKLLLTDKGWVTGATAEPGKPASTGTEPQDFDPNNLPDKAEWSATPAPAQPGGAPAQPTAPGVDAAVGQPPPGAPAQPDTPGVDAALGQPPPGAPAQPDTPGVDAALGQLPPCPPAPPYPSGDYSGQYQQYAPGAYSGQYQQYAPQIFIPGLNQIGSILNQAAVVPRLLSSVLRRQQQLHQLCPGMPGVHPPAPAIPPVDAPAPDMPPVIAPAPAIPPVDAPAPDMPPVVAPAPAQPPVEKPALEEPGSRRR